MILITSSLLWGDNLRIFDSGPPLALLSRRPKNFLWRPRGLCNSPRKTKLEVVSQLEAARKGLSLQRVRRLAMESSHPFPRYFAPPYCFPAREDGDQVIDIQPLAFDSVHNGQVPTSAFPLFKMPIELFNQVIQRLSNRDLQALSLVDRDCCRLAALSQFKDFKIDLNAKPLSDNHTVQPHSSPSLLTECVRQLFVTKYSGWGSHRGSTPSTSAMCGDIPLTAGYNASFDQVITQSFPNLQIFNWDGPSFSSSDIMRCIASSSLLHVRLRGVLLDPYIWERKQQAIHSISTIETLSLDISWDSNSREPQNVTFFNWLLQLVQANLRQIVWKGRMTDDKIFMADFDADPFPKLRSVVLDSIAADSTDIVRLLVAENTRIQTLSIDTVTVSNFFATRGYIDSLAQLSLIGHHWNILPYNEVLNFLENNTHLETLHLGVPMPQSVIDDHLVPSLQRNFAILTSLQLVFDNAVTTQTLQAIASLTALRRLWLSAGSQDLQSTWKICHEEVVKYLNPLLDLELLAFSQDTYTTKVHVLAPRYGDYYLTRAIPVDVDVREYLSEEEYLVYEGRTANADFEVALSQQRKLREEAWERWHVQSMLAIANECYFRAFKGLQWCFIGQLAFTRDGASELLDVSADGMGMRRTQRDPSLTSLRRRMAVDVWRPV